MILEERIVYHSGKILYSLQRFFREQHLYRHRDRRYSGGRRCILQGAAHRPVRRDIRPDTIRGLFLTHEHIDHIKGVRVLLKKYAIPLFASRETLEWLADRGELPSTGPVQEISASTVIAAGDMGDPSLCHQPRFTVQLRLCGEPARWAQDLGSH